MGGTRAGTNHRSLRTAQRAKSQCAHDREVFPRYVTTRLSRSFVTPANDPYHSVTRLPLVLEFTAK